ncbi:AraC family transcriptional regulator [Nocardiopsis coralliicola]
MDDLAGLLDGPRARGAFLLRTLFDPPWGIRVADRAPLTLMVLVRGTAWVSGTGRPVQMRPGDAVLARGPAPYSVSDSPAVPPRVRIGPGQECTALSGAPVADRMDLGVRTWGDGPGAADEMVVGTYLADGEVSRRLLDLLPPLAHVPAGDWDSGLLDLLSREVTRREPGQDVVLDRILDLMLVSALRGLLSAGAAAGPSWYRARTDPLVGQALRLLHTRPERPWTVALLASECGASRAALAARFSALVGRPPIAYLTDLRLALAADLLRSTDATLAAIARRVGYASPFAFSAAFTRVHGVSPSAHRAGRPGA